MINDGRRLVTMFHGSHDTSRVPPSRERAVPQLYMESLPPGLNIIFPYHVTHYTSHVTRYTSHVTCPSRRYCPLSWYTLHVTFRCRRQCPVKHPRVYASSYVRVSYSCLWCVSVSTVSQCYGIHPAARIPLLT